MNELKTKVSQAQDLAIKTGEPVYVYSLRYNGNIIGYGKTFSKPEYVLGDSVPADTHVRICHYQF